MPSPTSHQQRPEDFDPYKNMEEHLMISEARHRALIQNGEFAQAVQGASNDLDVIAQLVPRSEQETFLKTNYEMAIQQRLGVAQYLLDDRNTAYHTLQSVLDAACKDPRLARGVSDNTVRFYAYAIISLGESDFSSLQGLRKALKESDSSSFEQLKERDESRLQELHRELDFSEGLLLSMRGKLLEGVPLIEGFLDKSVDSKRPLGDTEFSIVERAAYRLAEHNEHEHAYGIACKLSQSIREPNRDLSESCYFRAEILAAELALSIDRPQEALAFATVAENVVHLAQSEDPLAVLRVHFVFAGGYDLLGQDVDCHAVRAQIGALFDELDVEQLLSKDQETFLHLISLLSRYEQKERLLYLCHQVDRIPECDVEAKIFLYARYCSYLREQGAEPHEIALAAKCLDSLPIDTLDWERCAACHLEIALCFSCAEDRWAEVEKHCLLLDEALSKSASLGVEVNSNIAARGKKLYFEAMCELDSPAKAIAFGQALLKEQPEEKISICGKLAEVYYKMEDPRRARQYLEASIEEGSQDVEENAGQLIDDLMLSCLYFLEEAGSCWEPDIDEYFERQHGRALALARQFPGLENISLIGTLTVAAQQWQRLFSTRGSVGESREHLLQAREYALEAHKMISEGLFSDHDCRLLLFGALLGLSEIEPDLFDPEEVEEYRRVRDMLQELKTDPDL